METGPGCESGNRKSTGIVRNEPEWASYNKGRRRMNNTKPKAIIYTKEAPVPPVREGGLWRIGFILPELPDAYGDGFYFETEVWGDRKANAIRFVRRLLVDAGYSVPVGVKE